MRKYYVIKVDYRVYDPTKKNNISKKPMYLYVTRDSLKIFIFRPTLFAKHFDLKWFETLEDAQAYINQYLLDFACMENPRIEEIIYDL